MSVFYDSSKNQPKVGAMVTAGFTAIFGLSTALGSFYTVEPSEMANVRRMGSIVHDKPVEPGIHLKMPFIDSVDRVQVSLTTLHIPEIHGQNRR